MVKRESAGGDARADYQIWYYHVELGRAADTQAHTEGEVSETMPGMLRDEGVACT